MLLWEYEFPSCIKDDISPHDERSLRRKTCRFIDESSRKLQLPRIVTATSMVFFHRFYTVHAFSEHDRFEVAVACIFLAAKTEESPKKLTRVIQECWRLKNIALQKAVKSKKGSLNRESICPSLLSVQTGATGREVDIIRNSSINNELNIKSEEFSIRRDRILLLERVILHTIGFELSIDHPYKFLLEKINKLIFSPAFQSENCKGHSTNNSPSKELKNELIQISMNFANDSMYTSLCLQFPPEMIATSCVYMSAQCCGIIGIEGNTWLDILNGGRCHMNLLILISISVQILQVISDKRGSNRIIFKTIADDLEKLRLYLINTKYTHSLQKHYKVKRDHEGNNVIEINQKDCKHRRLE